MTPGRRRLVWIAAALLIVFSASGFVVGRQARNVARIQAGVTAKQLCSCVFVDGRDETLCRSDLPPGYDPVHAVVDHAQRAVHAWLPLLAQRAAAYRDGSGCTLQD